MATTTLAFPYLKTLTRGAFAVAAGLWLCTAQAGLFDDDEARRAILDLRQRIDASRQQAESANQRLGDETRAANAQATEDAAQLRRSLLELQNQIEALRAELARLRGQDEQLARDVAETQRKQKDLAQGLDERFAKFEPGKVTLDGKEFVADPKEKAEYDAALAIFRKGDYTAAQTALAEFIRHYPVSGYAPSALFFLGNAQYALRDYKNAVTNFRSMISLAPDNPRAPEAVLSIANCQTELKDTKSARKTLEDLVKAYPESEAASAAKDRLAKLPKA